MNFEHLNLVLQISESRSISGAAKALYISQPTVSKMLRSIEDELGFTLFVRSKAGISPTQSGRVFIEYARETLDKLRTLKANCSSNIEAGEHMLRVATNGVDLFRECFLRTVSRCSPEVDVFEYAVANLSDCVSAVSGPAFDLGLLFFPSVFERGVSEYLADAGLVPRVLGRLPVNILVGQDSPIGGSGAGEISVSSLSSCRVSFPHEENSFFSNILRESAMLIGCTKEAYSPRLYSDEEYLRVSASSMVPDPFNLQMYAYSDWVRNVYNQDEFRFFPDSSAPMARLGLACDSFPKLKTLRLSDAPFRSTLLEFHKSVRGLSAIGNAYVELIKSLLDENEEEGEGR